MVGLSVCLLVGWFAMCLFPFLSACLCVCVCCLLLPFLALVLLLVDVLVIVMVLALLLVCSCRRRSCFWPVFGVSIKSKAAQFFSTEF